MKLANPIETWQFRILAMFRNPELSALAAISLRDDFIEMEPLKARVQKCEESQQAKSQVQTFQKYQPARNYGIGATMNN